MVVSGLDRVSIMEDSQVELLADITGLLQCAFVGLVPSPTSVTPILFFGPFQHVTLREFLKFFT